MVGERDIVITGMGVVSPLGVGRDAFGAALLAETCAVRRMITLSNAERTTYYGASVDDFDGKLYVTPRKALKVMGREVQIAYSAAHLAWQDAGLTQAAPDPERIGVVYASELIPGAIEDLCQAIIACGEDKRMVHANWGDRFAKHIFPLWMLRSLPNMPACHVGIAVDARGPNNSLAQDEASGLLALGEAAAIIQRGSADLMVVGGIGARVTPTRLMFRAPGIYDQHGFDEATNEQPRCIPFDARRRGIAASEGGVAMVLETRGHALSRGASIVGVLRGYSGRCGQPLRRYAGNRTALISAARDAMEQAEVTPQQLAHVSAQGFSEKYLDIEEAAAITAVAQDTPVTAFSSYFGTAGAACGLFELAASVLAVRGGYTLPTLGYSVPDSQCPINVCTVRQTTRQNNILKLSFTPHGQAAAVVVQCPT